MDKKLIAINHLDEYPIIPIVEFSRDINKGEIVVSSHISRDGKKLLMISKLKGKAKVGDTKNLEHGQELIGLLFNNDESIEAVIGNLQKLREMKN
jgi:hypothetical protein